MRKDNLDIRREHEAIRNSVGFYDFTHQLLKVTGSDAAAFLDMMFVAAIGSAKIGEAKYTTMLNEEGVIIDDVIIFRVGEEEFWISTLYIAELIAWFDAHKGDFNVVYEDVTSITTMYAVQGPNSKAVLNGFLKDSIDDMKYFTIADNAIDDVAVKIARSGYTGELGYEIYVNPEFKELVVSKLNEHGAEFNIMEIGTDVIITSLPREKGYVLMSDLEGTNPLEVGFGWTVNWNSDFIGKSALEAVKAEGAKRKLMGFTVEDPSIEIEPGASVLLDGENIGTVTMFTYGYTVEKSIGFALVDKSHSAVGTVVEIDGHNATLEEKVFYDPTNERVRA